MKQEVSSASPAWYKLVCLLASLALVVCLTPSAAFAEGEEADADANQEQPVEQQAVTEEDAEIAEDSEQATEDEAATEEVADEAATQDEEAGVELQSETDESTEEEVAVQSDKTVSTNEELVAAVTAAQSGDTIKLGAGKYTLYNMGAQTKGKDLTFVGAGTGSTEWGIGATIPDPSKFGTEYNGDYSFDGAGTITFKDMTLQSGTADYLGFIRADNTVVDNCTINGKTFYWGYTSATFTNTTFNAPNYDYALWTYSSPTMTFDGCTFNTTGKCINVYRDYAGAAYTINFKDCTVNNESSGNWKEMFQGTKQVLNINDSAPSGQSYTINISGNNTLAGGKKLDVCNIACSRLFGFAGKTANNAGNTTVNIDGTTVFTAGKQVSHSMPAQHYTAGDDEDAYTITEGKWTTDPTTGLTTREIVKTCDYCGWSSKVTETEKVTKELPGDLLIDGDTESSAVVKVEAGFEHQLAGALQISAVQKQMADLEKAFKNPDGTSIALSDVNYGFTATLTVPDGITLPENVEASATGVADTYKVASTTVEGKTVTVKFELTDEAKANIKTYADLKSYVDKAGEDGWIKVSVNATIDKDVAAGKQLTVTGTVKGDFSATATSQYGTVRSFSYEWNGAQWADGKDAVAKDDKTIQLTVEVTKSEDPKPDPTPEPTPTPTPDPSTPDDGDDNGNKDDGSNDDNGSADDGDDNAAADDDDADSDDADDEAAAADDEASTSPKTSDDMILFAFAALMLALAGAGAARFAYKRM